MSEDELRKWLEKILRAIETLLNIGNREPVYDVAGAAKRLGLSEWYVRQMCNKGEIEATRIEGGAGGKGTWRITEEEIQRFLREGKRRPRRAG